MDILLSIIRWIIIIAIPVYFLNVYIKNTYKFSLSNYFAWLSQPSEYKVFSFPANVFSILMFVGCTFFFSLFVNRAYVKSVGEQVDYTYLGNGAAFVAQYSQKNDPIDKVYTVTSPDIEYNDTFNNIGLNQSFVFEANLTDGIGDTASLFSLANIFSLLLSSFIFFLIMLGPLHVLLKPMGAQYFKGSGDNYFKFAWRDSFDAFLRLHCLSLGKWFILLTLLIFVLIYSAVAPRQQFGERILALSGEVQQGKIIKGIPVEVSVIYKTIIVKDEHGENERKYVKTNGRNATFRFDNLFEHAVFVTTSFSTETSPELESQLLRDIHSLQKYELLVTENLGIDFYLHNNG